MTQRAKRAGGATLIVFTTMLWGSTFVVVQRAELSMPASGLVLGRFAVAAAVLLPFVRGGRRLWAASVELGLLLWAGYATQTIGLRYTTVGRSAFVTGCCVVGVPVWTRLAGGRVGRMVWPAAAVAVAGITLLSHDVVGQSFNRGDAWTLGCTVVWSLYIYRLERFARALPTAALTATHLLVVAALAAAWAAFDGTLVPRRPYPWAVVLYLGLATTAATTWLQTLGQRWLPAAQAAVLYTLEPVWASVFGFVLIGDRLGPRGLGGAALILAAAALSQLGPRPELSNGPGEIPSPVPIGSPDGPRITSA